MNYTVLIVDDSATMRKMIKRTVMMADLPLGEVLEADGGEEALRVLAEEQVDLVLADVNMPGMNGLEMTARMHADEALSSIPVIIISTEASATRLDELREHGVKGYVHKPFTPEQIRDVVNEVLGACHAGNK